MDVRTLCLGMLTFRDASGYDIKKQFQGPLRHFFDASYGSLYPALNKLADEGLLQCTAELQDKRPDKKIYRITPQGRIAFLDELMKLPGRDHFRSEFVATLLFADLLPARHLAALIDERLGTYEESMVELAARAKDSETVGQRFIMGLGLAMYRAAHDYLEENRHLVEGEALLGTSASE